MRPRAWMSWSTGKDSAFALHVARQMDEYDIVGLITSTTVTYDRVAMHGSRRELLEAQSRTLGLPCHQVLLPSPCTNEVYEAKMKACMQEAIEQGVRHIIFGDLYLSDIREYREANLQKLDMQAVFPLWQRDTREFAREMIDAGLVAHLVCVDPKKLDASFAGRRFDHALLEDLPAGVDPCGENGEFHTFVSAGPMFGHPIEVTSGPVVERNGFVYADLMFAAD
jgi:uncharacterized protein (TIGR00290 family)